MRNKKRRNQRKSSNTVELIKLITAIIGLLTAIIKLLQD